MMRMRMTVVGAVLAAAAGAGVAFAEPAAQNAAAAVTEAPASPYTVIEENARIAFVHSVTGFRVGADKTLILDGPGRRWYRVTLDRGCARDLPWEQAIAIRDRTGSFDRFSSVVIDGRRCFVRAVDQIEDPRPVDRALRAAEKAQG
jgi:hypothetical protein